MKWAIKSLLEDNKEITMWKAIRRMGIGLNISEDLKEKVISTIEEYVGK